MDVDAPTDEPVTVSSPPTAEDGSAVALCALTRETVSDPPDEPEEMEALIVENPRQSMTAD